MSSSALCSQVAGPVLLPLSSTPLWMAHSNWVFPNDIRDEIVAAVVDSPYLRIRIVASELEQLFDALGKLARPISQAPKSIDPLSRDPADDYLVAFARSTDC